MARDVYFRVDILNVLRAVRVASNGETAIIEQFGGVPGDVVLAAYRKGVLDALTAVGLGFGIDAVVGVDVAAPGSDRTVRVVFHKPEGADGRDQWQVRLTDETD